MMENIFRHLSEGENLDDRESAGVPLRIQEAAREVGRPVFFAVLTIIIVFAPLFTLQGVEGKLFQPMAVSIVFAMLASLGVALVVVPAFATFAFRRVPRHRQSLLMRPLAAVYERRLRWGLANRKIVVGGAASLLVGALALAPFLGTEFVPELEEGTLVIRVTLAPSSSLDTVLDVAEQLEAHLMVFPEVTYAASHIGRSEVGGDPEPVSNVEIFVGLKPVNEWTSATDRYALQLLME